MNRWLAFITMLLMFAVRPSNAHAFDRTHAASGSLLKRYPIESVRQRRFLKALSFFYGQRYCAASQSLSLDAIDNEVLRQKFREPRIHFALVYASRSCP